MSPALATLVCLAFIAYLFWLDLRRPNGLSHALWVPLAWMFIAGSRYVSSWLGLSPTFQTAADFAEGSPIDRAVFFSLIIAGVVILSRRKIEWARLFRDNWWLCLYLLYCLSSVTWTDEPFILLKRLVKDLGNFVMVLVVLTDRRPYEAMAALLRRLAFLTLPLSALFIKYYPGLARDYRPGGGVMYTGIGHQKNDLGLLCLLAGLYLLWELLRRDDGRQPNFARENKLVAITLGVLMLWLLNMSDSKTPVVCLTAAAILLTMGRFAFVARQPGWLVGATIASVPLVWILNNSQVKEFIFSLIGRDASLTNRTEVWELVGQHSGNPFVGVGFMSFWSGERIDEIWRQLGVQINQAHNGYIEQYLNLGIVGVGFIIGIMLFALLHIAREMKLDPGANMLRLSIVAAAALYNITEASFYGTNNMWVLFLLGVIQPPLAAQSVPAAAPAALKRVAARGLGALRPQALFARRLEGADTASRLRFKRQSQPARNPQPA